MSKEVMQISSIGLSVTSINLGPSISCHPHFSKLNDDFRTGKASAVKITALFSLSSSIFFESLTMTQIGTHNPLGQSIFSKRSCFDAGIKFLDVMYNLF